MSGRIGEREAIGLVAGFGLWSLAFVVLYGAHGLACGLGVRPGQGEGVARAVLIGLFALFLAAHLWLIAWAARRVRAAGDRARRFVRRVAVALAVAAAGATAWTGAPVLMLAICR